MTLSPFFDKSPYKNQLQTLQQTIGRGLAAVRPIRTALAPLAHALFLAHHLFVFAYAHGMHARVERLKGPALDQRIANITEFAPVFFTNWNLAIQTVYFAVAVAHDVTRRRRGGGGETIGRLKGLLFTGLVFPCSVFVSGMFWGVYSVDRELVLPEVCDQYIPSWLNHSIHTNVLVFLVVEVLVANQQLPSFRQAFITLSLLTLIYDTVFYVTYLVYGRFIYALFHVFNWPERILFNLSNYLLTVLVMKLGLTIERFKNRVPEATAKQAVD